jgi:predicted cupin superfamily sugar epimerase
LIGRPDGPTAEERIRAFRLMPHPEGGFYRETYRAGEGSAAAALPKRYGGPRRFSTAIYFLLRRGDVSRLHRLRSDEVWHFYEGASLRLHIFHQDGRYASVLLGRAAGRTARFQCVVPRGSWFGAEVIGPGSYALAGCTIAPGFEFADFELGGRDALVRRYPRHRRLIERLTPANGPIQPVGKR